MYIKAKKIIIFFSFFLICFGAVHFALAQDANSVVWGGQQGNIGSIIGLGDQDPRVIAAKIIRVFLGFLGIVAFGLIVYGGWVWMTAGGDEQKIDKAKKILTNAAIGFIIILSAFSITQLILNKFLEATGGGSGACESGTTQVCGCNGDGWRQCIDGTWGPCSVVGCEAGVNSFYIKSTTPNNGDINVIKNVRVRFNFNSSVNSGTVKLPPDPIPTFLVTNITDGGTTVNGAVGFEDNRIVFTPSAACPPSSCNATGCFDDNKKIRVEVKNGANGVLNVNGLELTCGGFSQNCAIEFDVGTKVDCESPKVSLDFNQACVMPNNNIFAFSSDDSGISSLDFFVQGAKISTIINGANNSPFNTRTLGMPAVWDGSGFKVGDAVTFKVKAFDVDSNEASAEKLLKMRPDHCCNGVLDADKGEEQVDCGGECAACDGAACGVSLVNSCNVNPDANCDSNNCSSGFCNCGTYAGSYCQDKGYDPAVGNKCCICENAPIIDWVTPLGGFCSNDFNKVCQNNIDCGIGNTCNLTTANGAEGNFVTIGGRYFDVYQAGTSKVEFSKDNGNTWVNADLAGSANAVCGDTWGNNQIIVVVPKEADIGPSPKDKILIKITNKGGFSDATNDARGPILDFVFNNINRPGLCKLSPIAGKMNDLLTYDGIRFIGITEARFGNNSNYTSALNSNFANPLQGTARVPNINTGTTTTYIINSVNVTSNYLDFRKAEEAAVGPFITSFNPSAGAPGQYVTILGGGFGGSRGTNEVWFGPANTGTKADYNFPKICADSVWRDDQVIVKVPAGLADGNYIISMKIGTSSKIFNIDSSKLSDPDFTVGQNLPLLPSLCKIDPILGPALSQVSLWGEYFDNPDANSKVRFSLNAERGWAVPGEISSWAKDGDAYKAVTTVPGSAVSGPVTVIKNFPEEEGNGLNFKVGNCKANADCGALGLCCAPGSFKAGQCAMGGNPDDCFPPVRSSVFEWDFSTNVVTKPLTCSGYKDTEQCSAAGQCPNSPGECQTETNVSSGDCGTAYCNNTFSQCNGNCLYDDAADNINRCKLNPATCDQKNVVNSLTAECNILPTGASVWQVASTTTSCPTGSFKDINGWCTVGTVGNAVACKTCPAQFSCSKNECVINNNVCPGNSTCDLNNASPTFNKCKSSDVCECCCEVAKPQATCCAGLTCKAGGCGSDPVNYGLCTGCKVELDNQASTRTNPETTASDNACNCSGGSTRYCEVGLICDDGSGDCAASDSYGSPCGAGGNCVYDTGTCRDRKPCDSNTGNNICAADADNTMCDDNEFCDPTDCFCRPGTPCDGDVTTPGICEPNNTLCDIDKGFSCSVNDCVCKPKSCVADGVADCSIPTECTPGLEVCDQKDCLCKPSGGGSVGMKCNLPPQFPACGVPACSNVQNLDCLTDLVVPTNCPLCCCDPIGPPPAENSAGLKCTADKSPCAGGNRGLYCGCTDDTQCGDPLQAGCSFDTCCRARPIITQTTPVDKSINICRNAVITAKFDQLMDIASFTGNIIVVGDYGADTCPAGTQYILAKGDKPKGFFARTFTRVSRAFRQVLKPIIPSASALTNTFCAISGSASGYNNPDNTTTLTFSPSTLLDSDKKYYVIIKGDKNYTDGKREGILSAYGVTIDGAPGTWQDFDGNGAAGEDNDRTFNGVKFYGYVWAFNTRNDTINNGICTIGKVEVVPNSYLFNKTEDEQKENDSDKNASSFDKHKDNDKVFWAKALSADGQLLASTTAYGWDWSWTSSNTSVVDYDTKNPYSEIEPVSDRQLFEAQPKITDGFSEITAVATVAQTSEQFSGKSNVWVFICDNPWPAVKADGTWDPWADNCMKCSDNSGDCINIDSGQPCSDGTGTCTQVGGKCFDMNYQLYYCRDNAKTGTADDLPAIISDKTIMIGSSTDKNILKEYYFFREAAPDVSQGVNLSLTNQTTESTNGRVTLAWSPVDGGNVEGYKIYYGKKSGAYDTFITVKNQLPNPQGLPVLGDRMNPTYIVSNLKLNQTYYFTVTAYYSTGAESSYSAEMSILVKDSVAPAAPAGLNLSKACDGEAIISWNPNTDDTAGYKVFYGSTQSGSYGSSVDVKDATGITLKGLNNGIKYYLAVKAYDTSKNESNYSEEAAFTIIDSSSGVCFDTSYGLVLWQTFDNADISGTIAKDKSGKGYNGVIYGAIQDNGRVGQALRFNGNSDYVSFEDAAKQRIGPLLSDFGGDKITVAAWIKTNDANQDSQYIISKNGPFAMGASLWAAKLSAFGGIFNNVNWTNANNGPKAIDNNWHHILMAYDGINIRIFVDGVLDVSTPKTGNLGGDGCVQIGRMTSGNCTDNPGGYFNGLIDDVRIYNRVISEDEIIALSKQ